MTKIYKVTQNKPHIGTVNDLSRKLGIPIREINSALRNGGKMGWFTIKEVTIVEVR